MYCNTFVIERRGQSFEFRRVQRKKKDCSTNWRCTACSTFRGASLYFSREQLAWGVSEALLNTQCASTPICVHMLLSSLRMLRDCGWRGGGGFLTPGTSSRFGLVVRPHLDSFIQDHLFTPNRKSLIFYSNLGLKGNLAIGVKVLETAAAADFRQTRFVLSKNFHVAGCRQKSFLRKSGVGWEWGSRSDPHLCPDFSLCLLWYRGL